MFYLVVVAITLLILLMNWASHELNKRTIIKPVKNFKIKTKKRF